LVDRRQVKELSDKLQTLVEATEPRLHHISEAESMHCASPGGWSRKQVLGHLIDSASNNHQRLVRAMLQPSLDFPGYDQAGNVGVQAIHEAEWTLLVSLWAAYNRYLAHLIAHLPASKLDTPCRIGAGETVTLAFLSVRLSHAFVPSSPSDRCSGFALTGAFILPRHSITGMVAAEHRGIR
jgi:DinB superfamily